MQQTHRARCATPFARLAAVMAVVGVMPLLPARGEGAAQPGVAPQVSTTQLAAPVAQGVAAGTGAARVATQTLLDQLRALLNASQAALQRAEDKAKNTAATVTMPLSEAGQRDKTTSDMVVGKLRTARDAAQAAYLALLRDEQANMTVAEKKDRLTEVANRIMADKEKHRAESQKLIDDLQKRIDAGDKALEAQRQPAKKKHQDLLDRASKLQERGEELNRKSAAATLSANRELEISRGLRGLTGGKPSVKKSSFSPQPRTHEALPIKQHFFRSHDSQSDGCGVGVSARITVRGRFAQLGGDCLQAQQNREQAHQAVETSKQEKESAQGAVDNAKAEFDRALAETQDASQKHTEAQLSTAQGREAITAAKERVRIAEEKLQEAEAAWEANRDGDDWLEPLIAVEAADQEHRDAVDAVVAAQDRLINLQEAERQAYQLYLDKLDISETAAKTLEDKQAVLKKAIDSLSAAERELATADEDVRRACGGINV